MVKAIGIIPARYASTRFPGKPLADLGGMTVIERVCRQASKALSMVAVATDDERIARAVRAFGGTAVMTSASHRSGTDRVREALDILGSDADVVVNIQGDEPFIAPEQISALVGCFDRPDTDIATLARPYDPAMGIDGLADPNLVKLTMADDGRALYFSRSVIPYVRGCEPGEWLSKTRFLTHVGIYAYRADVLRRITGMPQSSLELAESLEQLRWLQNGLSIRVALTDLPTVGIDTPAALEAARRYLNLNGNA